MKFSELDGKKILILGYGKEGRSTERVLRLKVPSAHIEVADESTDPDYLDRQKGFDVAVKTPGMALWKLQIPHTTATNIFFANIKNKIIGVTGSKGKSTTASLIYAILKHAGLKTRLIGNIGSPALDVLLEPVDPQEIFVMELSSYQLEDIEYSPHVSVITSIFHEHLDHHGSFGAYFEAKARIASKATSDDYFVFNQNYAELAELAKKVPAKPVPFLESIPFDLTGLKLEGEHNLDNIRGALAVARIFGVPDEISREAVLAFEPLPHRLTFVGEFKGIKFYDDAIATAPEPTIFAIRTLQDVDTVFLGGTDRGYDFNELAKTIASFGIRNVVLFPDTGVRIAAALEGAQIQGLNVLHTRDMRTAVEFAYLHTAPGKICLLSTASPSYSLWKNFEAKGDEFVELVKELGA